MIYKVQKWIRNWGWVTVSIWSSPDKAKEVEASLKNEGYRTRIVPESE